MKTKIFLIFCFGLVRGDIEAIFHRVLTDRGIYSLNLSETCLIQLQAYGKSLENISNETLWAWKMLDATAKLPSGLLTGNRGDLGAFDECVEIATNATAAGKIIGKYCLGSLSFNSVNRSKNLHSREEIFAKEIVNFFKTRQVDNEEFLFGFQWAGCFPNGCTGKEMTDVLNYASDEYLGNIVQFQFDENLCQTVHEAYETISSEAIVAIVIFSIVIGLILISTVYDLYLQHTKSKPTHLILIAFSAYTNCKKLFTITSNNPDQLPCLNGLRVLSMMWVLLGHQFSSQMGVIFNGLDVINWLDSLHSMFAIGATVAVDTFFVLSGFLMTYGFLKLKSKGVPFNIPLYWLHRYLRLTPALAAITLFEATLTKYLTAGPMWPFMKSVLVENCKNYWWSTLLYIQNYVNVNELCLTQTWYLSVDMQLFILSPLLLIPLWKWKKGGLAILFLVILASIAVPFGVAWKYDLAAMFNPFNPNTRTFMSKYYYLTHTRSTPWLIGVLLGYCVSEIKRKNTTIKLNSVIVLLLWAISLSVLITCVFGGHSSLRGAEYEKWPQISYVVFVRPAWAIALSWVIFACIVDYGGPINWFLSFPIYQVLGKLTYSVYLLHLTIMYIRVLGNRLPIFFSDFENLYSYWGLTMFSCCFSILWVLAFESPMIIIEKVLFGKSDTTKDKQKKIEQV